LTIYFEKHATAVVPLSSFDPRAAVPVTGGFNLSRLMTAKSINGWQIHCLTLSLPVSL
jgi:hypothetical protein